MHDLQIDILELFAEAQHLGNNRRPGIPYGFGVVSNMTDGKNVLITTPEHKAKKASARNTRKAAKIASDPIKLQRRRQQKAASERKRYAERKQLDNAAE